MQVAVDSEGDGEEAESSRLLGVEQHGYSGVEAQGWAPEHGRSGPSLKLSLEQVDYFQERPAKTEANPLRRLCSRLRVSSCCRSGEQVAVLRAVSLKLRAGQLVCLMGPKHSGKTSLLRILGGRLSPSAGTLHLDRASLQSSKEVRHLLNYVPAEDVLYPSLTPRQLLSFLAQLQIPGVPHSERSRKVEAVIDLLKITQCADEIIGNSSSFSGLSTAERKRVSIAMGLISDPALLLIDEPTRDLDISSSRELVNLLHIMAAGGRTVVCTLRNPTWQALCRFHRLILLDQGSLIYDGPVAAVLDKFAAVGVVPPPQENPMAYLLTELVERRREGSPIVLSASGWHLDSSHPNDFLFISDPSRLHLSSSYTTQFPRSSSSSSSSVAASSVAPSSAAPSRFPQQPSSCFDCLSNALPRDPRLRPYFLPFLLQLFILLKRTSFIVIKDVPRFFGRLLVSLLVGLFLGLCYYQLPQTQAAAWGRISLLYASIMFVGTANLLISLRIVPAEITTVIREHRSGAFSSAAYYLASLVVAQFFQLLDTALFCSIVYWVAGLYPSVEAFFEYMGVCLLLGGVAVNLGLIIGMLSLSGELAQLVLMPFVAVLLLFTGYLILFEDIPDFLVWIFWLSFYQYGFKLLAISQFDRFDFDPCGAPDFCPFGNSTVPLPATAALEQLLGFHATEMALSATILVAILVAVFLFGIYVFWFRLKKYSIRDSFF